MRNFAALVNHRKLDAMSFFDEFLGVHNFDPQIVWSDFEAQTHFLKIVGVGLLAGLLLFFLLVINVLAIIHDAAHGRFGFRRNLDKIEFHLQRLGPPLIRGHDSQLIAGRSDDTDRLGLDLVVDAKSLCDGISPLRPGFKFQVRDFRFSESLDLLQCHVNFWRHAEPFTLQLTKTTSHKDTKNTKKHKE